MARWSSQRMEEAEQTAENRHHATDVVLMAHTLNRKQATSARRWQKTPPPTYISWPECSGI
jgi:hypothetical protein